MGTELSTNPSSPSQQLLQRREACGDPVSGPGRPRLGAVRGVAQHHRQVLACVMVISTVLRLLLTLLIILKYYVMQFQDILDQWPVLKKSP